MSFSLLLIGAVLGGLLVFGGLAIGIVYLVLKRQDRDRRDPPRD
jgi:hypothetical protein